MQANSRKCLNLDQDHGLIEMGIVQGPLVNNNNRKKVIGSVGGGDYEQQATSLPVTRTPPPAAARRIPAVLRCFV